MLGAILRSGIFSLIGAIVSSRLGFIAGSGALITAAGCSGGSSFLAQNDTQLQSAVVGARRGLALATMDEPTAALARKAGIAAFRDGGTMLHVPELFAGNREVREAVLRDVATPNIVPCRSCGSPPGPGGGGEGAIYEEVTTDKGDLYDANGMPDGEWVTVTTQYAYYGTYSPGGGSEYTGPAYYPSPPIPKITTCTIAAASILQTAATAASAILKNPAQFGALASKFAGAGITAAGVAGAYIEAGTATAAGAIAFVLELLTMMTPVGWLALLAAVAGLAILVASSYACKNGD